MLTPFRLAALFTAAAAGPYLASETEIGRTTVSTVTNLFRDGKGLQYSDQWTDSSSQPGSESTYANHSHYAVEKLRSGETERYRYDHQTARKLGALPSDPNQTPMLVGAPVPDLREVMRFDINPDWVMSRFARVSTVLSDLSLRGLRVPFVTGTRADDIAGTLTYYFDSAGTLQRVSMHGFTGDANRLVTTMTQHYGLERTPSIEAGVYTKRWNAQPIHFLRLTHAPVVYSDAVHHKYTVFMELNQPNLAYGISNEAKKIVTADRSTGRW